jgi:hypothetical protein
LDQPGHLSWPRAFATRLSAWYPGVPAIWVTRPAGGPGETREWPREDHFPDAPAPILQRILRRLARFRFDLNQSRIALVQAACHA